MEHGLIRLINSGGTSDAGFTQTIAGVHHQFGLRPDGRPLGRRFRVDALVALDTLQLFGTYDTI
jgi:hypothetical protein